MKRAERTLLTAQGKVTKALNSYLLERLGTEPDDRGEFTMDTPIGPMTIWVRDGWVYRRFTSHRGAAQFSSVANRCSGKWNLCLPCADADECLMVLQADLDRLEAYKPDADCLRMVREDIAAGIEQRANILAFLDGLRSVA